MRTRMNRLTPTYRITTIPGSTDARFYLVRRYAQHEAWATVKSFATLAEAMTAKQEQEA